jgi:hypothetical protein
MKRYLEFINEKMKLENDYLTYYTFDWDDNILIMPTKLKLQKFENGRWIECELTSSEFREYKNDERYKLLDDKNETFSEFSDNGKRKDMAFVEDAITAIKNKKFAPSFYDFIECLTNGSLFAIITARGHEDKSIRKAVEYIIDNVLSDDELYEMYNNLLKYVYFFKIDNDYDLILKGVPSENKLIKMYLDNCDFIGVSAESRGGNVSNVEKSKAKYLLQFLTKVNKFARNIGFKSVIGFSDDDIKNTKHIDDLLNNINKEKFPNVKKFLIKTTNDKENIKTNIIDFEN